jgi:hypothetical protein
MRKIKLISINDVEILLLKKIIADKVRRNTSLETRKILNSFKQKLCK